MRMSISYVTMRQYRRIKQATSIVRRCTHLQTASEHAPDHIMCMICASSFLAGGYNPSNARMTATEEFTGETLTANVTDFSTE